MALFVPLTLATQELDEIKQRFEHVLRQEVSVVDAFQLLKQLTHAREITRYLRRLEEKIRRAKQDGGDLAPLVSTLHFLVLDGNEKSNAIVTRVLGALLVSLGIQQRGHAIYITGGSVRAEYGDQVKDVLRVSMEAALEGILFIDQSRNLDEDAASALVELLREERYCNGKVALVMADSERPMRDMLRRVPGLRELFGHELHPEV